MTMPMATMIRPSHAVRAPRMACTRHRTGLVSHKIHAVGPSPASTLHGSVFRGIRGARPSVKMAAKKVAVPPPSPVNVEGLFAAATCYSVLLTVYLLVFATVTSLKRRTRTEEEVTFVYSTNAVGGLSRGKRVVGRGVRGGSLGQNVLLLLPLIAIYGVLLVNSYSPDTLSLVLPGSLKEGLSGGFNPQFIPKLDNISTLFSRVGVTASLWVHLLAVNAFCAISLMYRGLEAGIPVHHTIVLSMICGPLGFLSSWITERLWS